MNPIKAATIRNKTQTALGWAKLQKWSRVNVVAFVNASVTIISRDLNVEAAIVRAAFVAVFPEAA